MRQKCHWQRGEALASAAGVARSGLGLVLEGEHGQDLPPVLVLVGREVAVWAPERQPILAPRPDPRERARTQRVNA